MVAKRKTSNSKAMATWDEELAKYADAAATAEANAGGGQFFGLKGGILTWQDAPMPGNEMAVIILDTIFENTMFEGKYDPDNPASPVCFAFAHAEDELEPHEHVVKAGSACHDKCEGCEYNEWGSADTGRGKACKNTRRLAMIPAGQFDRNGDFEPIDNVDHFESTQMGFMKLPVTSVNGYASFVKQVAGALRRPPFGIITRVSVVSDPKTQFKVVFEPLEKITDADLFEVIMKRVEEAKSTIDFPYQLDNGDEVTVRGKGKAASRGKTAEKRGSTRTTTRRGKKY